MTAVPTVAVRPFHANSGCPGSSPVSMTMLGRNLGQSIADPGSASRIERNAEVDMIMSGQQS